MATYTLPLFPLSSVVFPDGLLTLKIFEARYLDMVRTCMRNNTDFGVVTLYPESQLNLQAKDHLTPKFPFATIGTTFSIEDADVSCLGLININCRGKQKFEVKSTKQQSDGLWVAEVEDIIEVNMPIPDDLQTTRKHLQKIISSLSDQDITELKLSIAKPYKLQDCAWVANRWCEILNIPLVQKQRMLELESPLIRLELIQDMLSKEFSNE